MGQRFHRGFTVAEKTELWDACYLEERFPSNPSLFGGAIGRGMARHINVWSDTQLGSPLRRVIYGDFPAVLDAEDRAYFRTTRERGLGMTLEAACADPEGKLAAFQQACAPAEQSDHSSSPLQAKFGPSGMSMPIGQTETQWLQATQSPAFSPRLRNSMTFFAEVRCSPL
jgi:hypothetical protein